MKNLFALFLLAAAFLVPTFPAQAACSGGACFWIGSTGTVDGTSDNGKWSTTTGGASCACVPATGDAVTFDGNSGGGTITINMPGALWTVTAFSMGNFTGTIDFATNSNSLTATGTGGISVSGAATKTLNMGSGTFTTSNNQGIWSCFTCANLTLNVGTSTIAFTGTGGATARRFQGGGKTYATVSAVSGTSPFNISGANTIGTLTIAPGNTVIFDANSTQTVTTMTNISGSSSLPTSFTPSAPITTLGIISTGNSWTCDWCGFGGMTFTGAGAKNATNSFDFKGNSGITITPPSAGGSGGRIIGG